MYKLDNKIFISGLKFKKIYTFYCTDISPILKTFVVKFMPKFTSPGPLKMEALCFFETSEKFYEVGERRFPAE